MSQLILDALKKLDAGNDEHWTTEGLPRLDVLKDLTGTQVTRDALNAVAKGFTRSNSTLASEGTPTPTPTPETEQTAAEGAAEGGEVALQVAEQNEGESYDEYLERRVKELSKQQSDANVALSAAQANFDKVSKELDKAITERDSRQKESGKKLNAVQQYLLAQQKARLEAAKG